MDVWLYHLVPEGVHLLRVAIFSFLLIICSLLLIELRLLERDEVTLLIHEHLRAPCPTAALIIVVVLLYHHLLSAAWLILRLVGRHQRPHHQRLLVLRIEVGCLVNLRATTVSAQTLCYLVLKYKHAVGVID